MKWVGQEEVKNRNRSEGKDESYITQLNIIEELILVASHIIDFRRQNHFYKRKPNMMQGLETCA